ncbi:MULTISPECIES: DUF1934 domain-containing protein [Enterococcus]|uniref:DUF1934 domain-containing protein n=1 Tax=Enterococcus TaxID=1350 RepID=UPI00065DD328|nr:MULTISPECIES: DUF1934 domain-containing protein [Enterococcus]KAF1303445.1 hypothetical protein BAU16_04495 [Enterococcus sp. JM9B]
MDVTNGLPISIKLATKVRQKGEVQDFLFDLQGQMVRMGDTLYIRYKEVQDNEEVPVTIKIMPDGAVQLTRAGEMRMRLKFVYREKMETSYKTPYGMMFFSTFTKDLHVSLKDRPTAGTVFVAYDLFMADEKIGEYQISLDFTA